jgi:hypothetical protein
MIKAFILAIALLGGSASVLKAQDYSSCDKDDQQGWCQFTKCFVHVLKQYDDQISPANVVARVISKDACLVWVIQMIEHGKRKNPSKTPESITATVMDTVDTFGTREVLTSRVMSRRRIER